MIVPGAGNVLDSAPRPSRKVENEHPDRGATSSGRIEKESPLMSEHDGHSEHTSHTHHETMTPVRTGAAEPEHVHASHEGHHEHMAADYRRRFVVCALVTLPVLALSPMIREWLGLSEALAFPGDTYVLFALATFLFVYGGSPFFQGMLSEVRHRSPGMMTLITVAISAAYGYSSMVVFGLPGKMFFWELATLIDVMLLGHWIEMKSVMGASRALEELARFMPSEAHRLGADGSTEDVPLNELRSGDRVLVRPGEKIPADGEIVEGRSWLDESMISGESKPIQRGLGEPVVGGSVNGDGSLEIEVARTGEESYLAQVIALVKQAQESKSRSQDLANRAAGWLTYVALGAGAVTLVAWIVIPETTFAFALERAITVMVISCPHALGLAVPLVVAVSTSLSAGRGLLIRDRAAFERARGIDAIVFDKTGTLTEGRFGVTDVIAVAEGVNEDEMLELAAAVEIHSEHPIARGIASAAQEHRHATDFRATHGKGVEGNVGGRKVQVVSPEHARELAPDIPMEMILPLSEQGKTVVFVVIDEKLAGVVALGDIVREESRAAVAGLKKLGIRCMMLTGDSAQVARWVADEVGLDEYIAEVLPDQKAEKIREIQSRGFTVAMTGDGVNDAPALAQADVGIAIGAGTDVAVETADIVLVRSNPLDALSIISLARSTYRKIVQNLIWATGYNAVAIPLAAGVLYHSGVVLTPAVGAMFMSISTVIVAINARLLRA
jgi:Cu2+-exporting ATPase